MVRPAKPRDICRPCAWDRVHAQPAPESVSETGEPGRPCKGDVPASEALRAGGTEVGESRGGQTFRAAFGLACLAAIAVLLPGSAYEGSHAQNLLVGFVPLLWIGFLSVALPRWTKRAVASRGILEVSLLCHALALLLTWVAPEAGLLLQVSANTAACVVLAHHSIVARARGAAYVVILVIVQSLAGAMAAYASLPGPVPTRISLSAIILLCLELGGRISYALVNAAHERAGLMPPDPANSRLVLAHRTFAAAAVLLWSLGLPCGVPAIVAGFIGIKRLALLEPWEARRFSGVAAMLAGVAWINLGFLALGLAEAEIGPISDIAIVHIWSVGGLGTTAIAVMTSVTRKRDKMSFRSSPLANAAYSLIAAAALARVLSAVLAGSSPALLLSAGIGWVAAFACCLAFLLSGLRSPPNRRIHDPGLRASDVKSGSSFHVRCASSAGRRSGLPDPHDAPGSSGHCLS